MKLVSMMVVAVMTIGLWTLALDKPAQVVHAADCSPEPPAAVTYLFNDDLADGFEAAWVQYGDAWTATTNGRQSNGASYAQRNAGERIDAVGGLVDLQESGGVNVAAIIVGNHQWSPWAGTGVHVVFGWSAQQGHHIIVDFAVNGRLTTNLLRQNIQDHNGPTEFWLERSGNNILVHIGNETFTVTGTAQYMQQWVTVEGWGYAPVEWREAWAR